MYVYIYAVVMKGAVSMLISVPTGALYDDNIANPQPSSTC